MSSTLSTQNRQTFLRRKYCFFPVAIALSPPVGRCEAAIGRPPLCSAMRISPYLSSTLSPALAGAAGAPGAPGALALEPALPLEEQVKPLPERKGLVGVCGLHASRELSSAS